MKEQAGEPLDLEAVAEQVVALLVSTFDYPEAEARHRINLWKARQHDLEGQALEGVIDSMRPEQQAQELLRWALEGREIQDELAAGAAALGLDLDPPPD